MTTQNSAGQGMASRVVHHSAFPMSVLTVLLIIFPYINPSIYLSTDILIFAILAMGFNLIFGHMGVITFGHAQFFGLGAYTTGLMLLHVYEGLTTIFFGALVATFFAAVIGYIVLKKFAAGDDPSLMALTVLAFSQMWYFLVWSPLKSITGGSDGLLVVPTPPLSIPGVFTFSLDDPYRLYFFVMVVFLICAWIIKRIIYSPFGRVLHGIRENELRVSFLGYNTFKFRLIAFTLSGLFGGVAGSLYTIRMNYVGLDAFHWMLSGEIIIMCLIGGMRTLWGPLIGSVILWGAKDYIATITQEWMGFIAVIVILLALYMPFGIWDKVAKLGMRLGKATK